jgi:hypothetical protein
MILKSFSYTPRSFYSTIYAAYDMEICIFHQAIQLMQLYDISLSMSRFWGYIRKKRKRKKREEKVRRERERKGQVSY